jgi:hypothetical protein
MVAWASTGTNKKNQINHLTPSLFRLLKKIRIYITILIALLKGISVHDMTVM